MKRSVTDALSILGLALVVALTGCGSTASVPPPPTPPVISTNPMPPAGMIGSAYPGFAFTVASGGTAPFTWSETGGLPPGMSFNGGALSGTPTMAGPFTITVNVTDQSSPPQSASHPFTIVVNNPPGPVISTNPPTMGVVNTAYPGFTFTVTSGGLGPFTWSEMGALPPGMTFNNVGVLSGTPAMANSFPITVNVTDKSVPTQVGSQMFTIVVNGPLAMTTASPLPIGAAGSTYFAPLSASGGAPPYRFALSPSSTPLPAGLSVLTTGTPPGQVSGVPTGAGTTNNIIIQVSDSQTPPAIATMNYSITINPPSPLSIITPSPLPAGTAGLGYGNSINATGGVFPYSFALAASSTPLPTGLTINSSGFIGGTPTLGGTTNNIVIQVTDSQTPTATSTTMTYTLTINPPLPLAFTTPAPLAAGGVSIYYAFQVCATGGVGPYNFTLAAGSPALPAGINLNSGITCFILAGTPTTAGQANVTFQVTDAQTPAATATMPYSITISPSTLFVGTQAPGDVWQMAVADLSPMNGLFGVQDQGSNGLTGPMGGVGSGAFVTLPSGFKLLNGVGGTAVKMPGEMTLFVPVVRGGRFFAPVNDKVVAAAPNTCPQLSVTTSYQFVALADEDFDLTKDAFGRATVTQTAANSYNFAFNSFKLDGTVGTSNTLPGLPCDSNLKVFSSTSGTGIVSTFAISASGVMIIDNGTGIPAVGLQQPAANLSPAAILGGQYLGTVFYANDNLRSFCVGRPRICHSAPAAASDLVGFGPGSATSISGGTYHNIGSDPFNAHATNYVVTLGTQTSPGLFTGGTLAIGGKTLTNLAVVAGLVNGKFVLFGVTLDSTVTPIQPYAVLLIQQ